MSRHTFGRHDDIYDVMTYYLAPWCVFDAMTNFWTSCRAFDVMPIFSELRRCLVSCRHTWHISDIMMTLFDVMMCILRHDVFLTS